MFIIRISIVCLILIAIIGRYLAKEKETYNELLWYKICTFIAILLIIIYSLILIYKSWTVFAIAKIIVVISLFLNSKKMSSKDEQVIYFIFSFIFILVSYTISIFEILA